MLWYEDGVMPKFGICHFSLLLSITMTDSGMILLLYLKMVGVLYRTNIKCAICAIFKYQVIFQLIQYRTGEGSSQIGLRPK